MKWRLGANAFLGIGSLFVILFFYFSILMYIYTLAVKIPSVLIVDGNNFRYYDKISSLLTEKIFTDKVFQYCYGILLLS